MKSIEECQAELTERRQIFEKRKSYLYEIDILKWKKKLKEEQIKIKEMEIEELNSDIKITEERIQEIHDEITKKYEKKEVIT